MPETDNTAPLIYLIAGESSGDNLGAGLIDGIRARCPGARFIGVGGTEMQSKGFESLFPMSDLSVMGIVEILPRLWTLLRRIRETAAHARDARPDIIVTIDSPDFSFRVARRLKGQGIAMVHYVAPTVWAWRPKRAAKIAGLYDHLLTLFPFEPPYFEREGLATTFVGHPVIHAKTGDGNRFRQKNGFANATPILCLLPGSRHSEVSRLLPVFVKTFQQLREKIPLLQGIIPTVPHLEAEIRQMVQGTHSIGVVVDPEQKKDALAASTAALAASGTIALELAIAGVPSVIAYRVNTLTAMVARRMLLIPYMSLVNILLAKEVMPERIQEHCTPDELYGEILPLLSDGEKRQQQLAAFELVRQQLSPENGQPDDIAAQQILKMINDHPKQD
ncbi:MAG: lipid-A-disaccharide synthase [Rhodospirillales bacterium]|nr:lipid-A-disaccharide synthase [Rhodospirillales bacterium]